MRQILKQKISSTTMEINIVAPEFGFNVLTVHEDNDVPTIWYEISEEKSVMKTFIFKCVRTGDYAPKNGKYVGTAHCKDHNYHVYQI